MPTIAEVRQKFPQYADLSDEKLAQGLHQKFYSDVPFEEFSQKIGLGAPAKGPEPEKGTDWMRQIALAGRAAGEGVVGAIAAPHDLGVMIDNLGKKGVNKLLGTNYEQKPTFMEGMSGAMNGLGAYSPETSGEQYASAGIKGVTGALTMGGGLGNIARTGVAGATGSLASEGARQNGVGPGGQMVAGFAGGFAPASMEELLRLGTTTAGNMIRPMTRGGQQQMAGNIMAKHATDPAAAAQKLETAAPIIPNSPRMTGEASQDIGLLSLEKGVRARNPGAFGTRVSEQNAARQAEMRDLGGSPADLAAAKRTRDAVTTPMREEALASGRQAANAPLIQHIDEVLTSPVGERQIVKRALTEFREQLEGKTDPARLYEIRKDINDAMMGKLAGDKSVYVLARKELGDLKNVLDEQIESAAPGFKAYLERYKDMSKPVDQMKAIQEIQKRAELTSTDITTGQNFIGNAAFSRALDSAIEKSGAKLTPDQSKRLEAIRTDLQYGQAINSPLVKPPGSDTFQNLSIAQVIGAGSTNAHPAIRVLTKPLDWVYKIAKTDEAVNEILVNAMLDPKLAAAMLRRATPASVQAFAGALKVRSLQNTAGVAGGLSSSPPAPSADRNMSQAGQ